MSAAPLQEAFKHLVGQAAEAAAAEGFSKRDASLWKLMDGNAAIINFQRSTGNTSDRLAFTINLSVVCGLLLDPQGPPLKSAKEYDGHLRQRIGMLMPDRRDKWWEITAVTKIEALSADIVDLMLQVAVPYLTRYSRNEAIVALWESGMAPGLTPAEHERHLSVLKKAMETGA